MHKFYVLLAHTVLKGLANVYSVGDAVLSHTCQYRESVVSPLRAAIYILITKSSNQIKIFPKALTYEFNMGFHGAYIILLAPQSDFTGRDSCNPSFVANLRSWYLQLHVIWIPSPTALSLSLFCIRVLFSFPTQAATDYLCSGVSAVDCGTRFSSDFRGILTFKEGFIRTCLFAPLSAPSTLSQLVYLYFLSHTFFKSVYFSFISPHIFTPF